MESVWTLGVPVQEIKLQDFARAVESLDFMSASTVGYICQETGIPVKCGWCPRLMRIGYRCYACP